MDPVAIGIFVVCGLLVGGAIALRRPKLKVEPPKTEGEPGEPADMVLKIPEDPDNKDVDRPLQ
jgi:hypothetical protein